MKTTAAKIFIALMIMQGAASAQINTPEGEMVGGNAKDTAHFVDKPSMHSHEETIVLKEKHAKQGAESISKAGVANDTMQSPAAADTSAAQTSANQQGTSSISETSINTSADSSSSGNCMNYIYGALGILVLGAIILFFVFRRRNGEK